MYCGDLSNQVHVFSRSEGSGEVKEEALLAVNDCVFSLWKVNDLFVVVTKKGVYLYSVGAS
mgnify:FL=1